jgi:hypothetical protein
MLRNVKKQRRNPTKTTSITISRETDGSEIKKGV